MKYSPTQKNPKLNLIFAALLVLGGIAYAIPIVCSHYGVRITSLPFSFVTLFAIVAALFLLIRYRMTSFTYVIRPRGDTDAGDSEGLEKAYAGEVDITRLNPELLDFCVYKASGSRAAAMECLLSLGELVRVVEISRKTGSSKPTKYEVREDYEGKGGMVYYDYTLTLGIDDALELVFIDGNRYVGIIIEPDDKMREYFLRLKG